PVNDLEGEIAAAHSESVAPAAGRVGEAPLANRAQDDPDPGLLHASPLTSPRSRHERFYPCPGNHSGPPRRGPRAVTHRRAGGGAGGPASPKAGGGARHSARLRHPGQPGSAHPVRGAPASGHDASASWTRESRNAANGSRGGE